MQLSDSQGQTLPTQFELTKVQHERDLLDKRAKYLEEELQKKAADDRTARSQLSDKIAALENVVNTRNSELEEKKKIIESQQVGCHSSNYSYTLSTSLVV